MYYIEEFFEGEDEDDAQECRTVINESNELYLFLFKLIFLVAGYA